MSLLVHVNFHEIVQFLIWFCLSGAVFCCHAQMSGPEPEATVRPGDNITLYCDCKRSTGTFISWFRNCSHENQPSLILRINYKYDPSDLEDKENFLNPFPHLHLMENQSSKSSDLLLMNITHSDEGLYCCGIGQEEIDTTFFSEICLQIWQHHNQDSAE